MTAAALARYYSESYPPSLWAPAPVPSTGATAGIPGVWTPAGSHAPASVAALIAASPVPVTATPATAWTAGQYVQTRTSGAAGRATWTGAAWVGGVAPLSSDPEPEPDPTDEPCDDDDPPVVDDTPNVDVEQSDES